MTLNRPDRLNAWTYEMQERLHDLLEEAGGDPAIRVIVLTGSGPGFCAGADMDYLGSIIKTGDFPRPSRQITLPMTIPKPVIAAINGACVGMGIACALACDIRFAAAGARFGTAFARRGLVAEHGTSWLLPRVVGPSNAFDLLASGRMVGATEAHGMGLVDRVVPDSDLMSATLAYARELADLVAPAAVAVIKRQIYRHLQTSLDQAVHESNLLTEASLLRKEFHEGVASFVERRPPLFAPLTESADSLWVVPG